MYETFISLIQGAGKPGIFLVGFILMLLPLYVMVQGMKRFGCIDAVACPSLFGLAGAGGLLVFVRLMV
ncbi:MAG TPA: hypothetical protein ENJ35_04615 [Gammaproteobacteria bacterium]|nr:hypothetical protein [Gammaproteobacteria bacterium]